MCAHTCAWAYIYIYIYTHAHMYGCTHARVYTYMCIYPTQSVTIKGLVLLISIINKRLQREYVQWPVYMDNIF